MVGKTTVAIFHALSLKEK